MVKDNRNCIAFKFNYCDGVNRVIGEDLKPKRIGFCGVCSKELINYNINVVKRSWCSRSDCKRYIDGKISYDELKNYWSPYVEENYPCYDSIILRDWILNAGSDENGDPRKISKIDDIIRKLCILTTIKPGYKENDRIVFAMFIIGDTNYGDDSYSKIIADDKYCLEFYYDEVDKLKYWEIHKLNKDSSKEWGSGLFRYFDNEEAIKFIKKAVEIKKGTSEENFAKEFLSHYCKINNIKNFD